MFSLDRNFFHACKLFFPYSLLWKQLQMAAVRKRSCYLIIQYFIVFLIHVVSFNAQLWFTSDDEVLGICIWCKKPFKFIVKFEILYLLRKDVMWLTIVIF